MIPSAFEKISETDLQSLIDNAVAEGRTIEYKQALPGGNDSDRKEFLADVSSFANTSGGDLIFGISEDKGVPTGVVGIGITDPDLEFRRLDSIIAAGLDPRIRYNSRIVETEAALKVLLVRIEKSWYGPHRVIFKGHDKFYGRNVAGKYPLDVNELRVAFTLSSTVTERIRAFRTDRIIALSNNETPVPFTQDPKLVLHCIPIESFGSNRQCDVLKFYENPLGLAPKGLSYWDRRLNLEGLVAFNSGTTAHWYTQLYRNGVIETVDGSVLAHEYNNQEVIPSIAYEERIFSYLPVCLRALEEVGCTTPIVVALTLINVRGLRMGVDTYGFETGYPIQANTLILPETVVEDFSMAVGKILKPMFDIVWNACGYPSSKNFDAEGNWIKRR
jgi:hypothetical protein